MAEKSTTDTTAGTTTTVPPAPQPKPLEMISNLSSETICTVVPAETVIKAISANIAASSQATCEPDAGAWGNPIWPTQASARYTPGPGSNYANVDVVIINDEAADGVNGRYSESFSGDLSRTIQFGGQAIECTYRTPLREWCKVDEKVISMAGYLLQTSGDPAQLATDLRNIAAAALPTLYPDAAESTS